MARKGRVDRGLYAKPDVQGKQWWHVRLFHNGKSRKFGPFTTKTMAREFYEKCKREQREGQFFSERYHQDGYPLVVEWIVHYLTTLPGSGKTLKTQREERRYAGWWKTRLAGKRLHRLTPEDVEAGKRNLVENGYAPETIRLRTSRFESSAPRLSNLLIAMMSAKSSMSIFSSCVAAP